MCLVLDCVLEGYRSCMFLILKTWAKSSSASRPVCRSAFDNVPQHVGHLLLMRAATHQCSLPDQAQIRNDGSQVTITHEGVGGFCTFTRENRDEHERSWWNSTKQHAAQCGENLTPNLMFCRKLLVKGCY